MNTSVILITWNEQEMLPSCLACLEGMSMVGEIIVVDSFSTDRTIEIIKDFQKSSKKKVILHQQKFEGFADQWNVGIKKAQYDWIFFVAADETWTPQLDNVLKFVDKRPDINAIRLYTLVTFGDNKHYINQPNLDPQVRLFRRNFAWFQGRVLEEIVDKQGRLLMSCSDPDILNCNASDFPGVWRKHHQLLKSKESLLAKGKRWEAMDLLDECRRKGIPVDAGSWASWKEQEVTLEILPPEWYDPSNYLE